MTEPSLGFSYPRRATRFSGGRHAFTVPAELDKYVDERQVYQVAFWPVGTLYVKHFQKVLVGTLSA